MQKTEYLNYYVTCSGVEVNVNDVEFIDVEEDFNGRDLMTFQYNSEVRKSYVRSYPSDDYN
jgi:hypothetical protein